MFSLCADFFALLVAFKNWSEQQNSVPGQSARNLLSSICNNSAKTCSNLQKFISICSFAFPSLIQNNYFDQRLLFKGKYVGLTPPLVARTRVGNMSPEPRSNTVVNTNYRNSLCKLHSASQWKFSQFLPMGRFPRISLKLVLYNIRVINFPGNAICELFLLPRLKGFSLSPGDEVVCCAKSRSE